MTDSSKNDEGRNVPAPLDAFDEIEDERVEGEGDEQTGRIIQGIRLMFGNDFIWTTSDDEEFPKDQELCVVDTVRLLQKWIDHKVVDAIPVLPSQKWPDIEKLNDTCPKSEWQEGPNGQPQGPWQRTRVVYFVDLATMQKYTYASGTVGADICVREFRDRVRTMRRFRGESVYAIVTLGDTYMPTRWGGRQRPDFKIQRWIKLGGDGGDPNALPKPSPTALPPATTKEALDRFAENKEPEAKAEAKAGAKKVTYWLHAFGPNNTHGYMIVDDDQYGDPCAIAQKITGNTYRFNSSCNVDKPIDDAVKGVLFCSAKEFCERVPQMQGYFPSLRNKRGVVKTDKKKQVGKPVNEPTLEEILDDEIPPELR